MTVSYDTKGFIAKNVLVLSIAGLLIFSALSTAVYFYLQYQKTQEQLKNPQAKSQQEVKMMVDDVGKLMILPTNETPQIATVSDINKLKGQSFFAQAKNGDVVLIYTKNQKAILYDPMAKKIKEVGPINLSQNAPSAAPTPSTFRVALYNGSTTVGLTTKVEQQLKTALPQATVVEKANAKKTTYTKTVVVDLTGKNPTGAKQLAQAIGGEVGQLPTGEVASTGVLGASTTGSASAQKDAASADFLVILATPAK